MLETAAKKIKIVRPGDNVMVTVPDLDKAKIDAQCARHLTKSDQKIEFWGYSWELAGVFG